MPPNSQGRALLIHQFTHQQQLHFAEFSGDANPLHTDPLEARRTLMGAPIVHGMHLVFAAPEALNEVVSKGFGISAIRCRFPSPVIVGDRFELRLKNLDTKLAVLEGYVETDLAVALLIEFDEPTHDADEMVPDLQPVQLQNLAFDDLAGRTGTLHVGVASALAESLFPNLVAMLGLPKISELLALTRLVGMCCPGRNSLFSEFDVTIKKAEELGELRFRVAATDERFKRIIILVEGARLSGKLIAFVRPPPQSQPPIEELGKLLRHDEFRDSVALVIGGSRGLGEITAKLLAAGGAQVTISYHRGEQDAVRVAGRIESFGGRC
jgi:acyl dehydratase